MSSFLCALGQRCLDGISICGPGDWTFFGTPLFWSYWDLLSGSRSDRICAEGLGAAVGPSWLVTEAPDHQQTLGIWLEILVGWGRVLRTVLLPSPVCWDVCMLERVRLKLHPCLTPRPYGKKCIFCHIPPAPSVCSLPSHQHLHSCSNRTPPSPLRSSSPFQKNTLYFEYLDIRQKFMVVFQ